jgi:hypothetical protein
MEDSGITPTPFYRYRPASLLRRLMVWVCGRMGHGKQELIESYSKNITHPPRKVHETWPVRLTVIQGKWRCRCCHNVSIRAVEVKAIIIDKTK